MDSNIIKQLIAVLRSLINVIIELNVVYFYIENISPYLEKWNKILELLFMSIKPPAMSDYYKWL